MDRELSLEDAINVEVTPGGSLDLRVEGDVPFAQAAMLGSAFEPEHVSLCGAGGGTVRRRMRA